MKSGENKLDTELPLKRIGFCRNAARQLLQEYKKAYGDISLPVPIDNIAEFKGYEVHLLESFDEELSALVDREDKCIMINKKHHPVRQRFSIGHELGHICLGHPPEHDSSKEEIKLYNAEADTFAAELLIPLERLKIEIKKIKDFKSLADIFKVSEQAITIKILEQNLLSKI